MVWKKLANKRLNVSTNEIFEFSFTKDHFKKDDGQKTRKTKRLEVLIYQNNASNVSQKQKAKAKVERYLDI